MYALELWDEARLLLDVATASLDTLPSYNAAFPNDAPLAGAPDRRFLSDGLPAYDCPAMLAVHMQTSAEFPPGGGGIPGSSVQRAIRMNAPQLVLTCIRCRPASLMQKEPPPVKDLNRAARQHMADGWALWNGVWRAIVAGQLFSKCSGVDILGGIADDPAGGSSGWVFRYAPVVGGYDPIPDYVAPDLATLATPTR